jgi:hypothetical protein
MSLTKSYNSSSAIYKPAKETKNSTISFYTRLTILYLLNVVDWLCTEALLASGNFLEANPLMQSVFNDFWLTIIVKGVLPLAMIEICAIIYRHYGSAESSAANFILTVGIIGYILVILWHILNFVLLFWIF